MKLQEALESEEELRRQVPNGASRSENDRQMADFWVSQVQPLQK